MKGLYDDRGQLIGWTDKNLEQILTVGSFPSQPRVIPKEVVAPYVVHKDTDAEDVCGPRPWNRPNKRHARRLAALDQLRINEWFNSAET